MELLVTKVMSFQNLLLKWSNSFIKLLFQLVSGKIDFQLEENKFYSTVVLDL